MSLKRIGQMIQKNEFTYLWNEKDGQLYIKLSVKTTHQKEFEQDLSELGIKKDECDPTLDNKTNTTSYYLPYFKIKEANHGELQSFVETSNPVYDLTGGLTQVRRLTPAPSASMSTSSNQELAQAKRVLMSILKPIVQYDKAKGEAGESTKLLNITNSTGTLHMGSAKDKKVPSVTITVIYKGLRAIFENVFKALNFQIVGSSPPAQLHFSVKGDQFADSFGQVEATRVRDISRVSEERNKGASILLSPTYAHDASSSSSALISSSSASSGASSLSGIVPPPPPPRAASSSASASSSSTATTLFPPVEFPSSTSSDTSTSVFSSSSSSVDPRSSGPAQNQLLSSRYVPTAVEDSSFMSGFNSASSTASGREEGQEQYHLPQPYNLHLPTDHSRANVDEDGNGDEKDNNTVSPRYDTSSSTPKTKTNHNRDFSGIYNNPATEAEAHVKLHRKTLDTRPVEIIYQHPQTEPVTVTGENGQFYFAAAKVDSEKGTVSIERDLQGKPVRIDDSSSAVVVPVFEKNVQPKEDRLQVYHNAIIYLKQLADDKLVVISSDPAAVLKGQNPFQKKTAAEKEVLVSNYFVGWTDQMLGILWQQAYDLQGARSSVASLGNPLTNEHFQHRGSCDSRLGIQRTAHQQYVSDMIANELVNRLCTKIKGGEDKHYHPESIGDDGQQVAVYERHQPMAKDNVNALLTDNIKNKESAFRRNNPWFFLHAGNSVLSGAFGRTTHQIKLEGACGERLREIKKHEDEEAAKLRDNRWFYQRLFASSGSRSSAGAHRQRSDQEEQRSSTIPNEHRDQPLGDLPAAAASSSSIPLKVPARGLSSGFDDDVNNSSNGMSNH